MKLSIIIVSWKAKDRLRDNLESLLHSHVFFEFEVFVVDNNSQDGTVEMVKKEFSQVKVIANEKNLGFSAANNQAIKLAQGDFILLLNPDMKVYPDTLEKMLSWAENNSQAIVSSCRLIDNKGQIIKHVRRFPDVWDQLWIVLKFSVVFPFVLNKYLNHDFDFNKAGKVDSVRGSFFLINTKEYYQLAKDKPYLDERYFIWFEEVDFCRQIYKLGGEVWYTPQAECLDYIGQSFNQINRSTKQRYFKESMLKYFAKWEPKWKYRILSVAWKIILIIL